MNIYTYMNKMQTPKYFTKFRQHNGRVGKRNRTRIELRPSRYLKASQLVQGCHASNSHAGGMYFIYFLTLTTLNFSQPQAGIFQPHWVFFNHNPNNHNHKYIAHGLWTRGDMYIYIYIYIYI